MDEVRNLMLEEQSRSNRYHDHRESEVKRANSLLETGRNLEDGYLVKEAFRLHIEIWEDTLEYYGTTVKNFAHIIQRAYELNSPIHIKRRLKKLAIKMYKGGVKCQEQKREIDYEINRALQRMS